MPPRIVPRAGPNVWTGDAMLPSHWMLPVGGDAAAELLAVAASLGDAKPERPADAPLPRLGPVLREAADRLENGAGFALLRGLAAHRFTAATAGTATVRKEVRFTSCLLRKGLGDVRIDRSTRNVGSRGEANLATRVNGR